MPERVLNLFTPAFARRSDPATSHAAAAEIAPRVSGQCAALRDFIAAHPSMTGHELSAADGCPLDYYTVMRRVSVLERAGLIEVTGERACSVTGRLARAYRATGVNRG